VDVFARLELPQNHAAVDRRLERELARGAHVGTVDQHRVFAGRTGANGGYGLVEALMQLEGRLVHR
jgi:hypothetical protein